jgi:hypothetical protein
MLGWRGAVETSEKQVVYDGGSAVGSIKISISVRMLRCSEDKVLWITRREATLKLYHNQSHQFLNLEQLYYINVISLSSP